MCLIGSLVGPRMEWDPGLRLSDPKLQHRGTK